MIYRCNTYFVVFLVILFSVTLTSCLQDDVNPDDNNIDSVSEMLASDNGLVISLLTDEEDNETYYFESYVFNFALDGSVVATNSSDTVHGNYSIFREDGRIELSMSFPSIRNFNELNDEWYFISINQNRIRFSDDGDILEFQRQ